MTIDDYLTHITSPVKMSLSDFSSTDRKGIEEGRAFKGMTKEGVMMALGYPATHRTPSPDSNNSWIYWANRFRTIEVVFNNNGIVTEVVQ